MNSATETAIPLGSSPLTDLFALLASVGRAARQVQELKGAAADLGGLTKPAGGAEQTGIGSPATAELEEEKEEERGQGNEQDGAD